MTSGPRQPRRPPSEHLLAWLYTGPLGHLWSVAGDVVLAWTRYAAARLRGRAL